MKTTRIAVLVLILVLVPLRHSSAEYWQWSFFGGLNLIYNGDGNGTVQIPGMQSNGNPGGLASAPSPLCTFLGAEYRMPLSTRFVFAPSATLYSVQYLWANDRPLPAEIENRTALVPSLLLDAPLLYTFENNRFLFSFGGGLAILARYGILEIGIPADTINPGETLTAGQQVSAINSYFWNSGRWLYPTLQADIRYRLETGWGAGLMLRAGIPLFDLWSPGIPAGDSFMLMAALSITPPAPKPKTR